jgi:transaldolase
MNRPRTKILVDGGDPQETRQIKNLLGFVDGQTTNPSLIANNPEIRALLAAGHKLSEDEDMAEYRKIVQEIFPLVGEAGVSIEVFSDRKSTAQEMFAQGKEMYTWIPNAYIKYPCTAEGLRAAQMSVQKGFRVNLTLCFSQQQAAAVYAATKGTRAPAYVSPFVGRLDDIGQNGMDLVKNAKRMLAHGDGHLLVLAASIRNLEQLLCCFWLDVDLVTVPAKVLRLWAEKGFPLPEADFQYFSPAEPIPYEELDLARPWETFNIAHELTTKGLEKFAGDYRKTLAESAGSTD